MLHIVENTHRDGSYVIDFQFSREDTQKITRGLDSLGFEFIEVGHGLGLGAGRNPKMGLAKENDQTYITSAKENAQHANIGVFFIPGIGNKEDIRLAHEAGSDFIRIGANVDKYQITREYAEYAKSLGLFVGINLMKSYGVKSYEFTQIVSDIDSWGIADVIYLVDSAGCMMPQEVFEYISRTRERVKTSLGFHGHNNLSLAVANSLQAVQAGAKYVDTCVRGMGRSAGNAQTEIVIFLLQKMGILDQRIDLYKLYDFANQVIVPLMPRQQGLSDEEIHIGVSKFHSSYMPVVNKVVDKLQVDKKRLIKKVSDVNCINPSEELFMNIAAEM